MATLEQMLIKNMLRGHIIGGKHSDIITLTKGFPKHRRKEVKKAIEELIKEGLLIIKPTNYGLHVSLDPEQLPEIIRRIEE